MLEITELRGVPVFVLQTAVQSWSRVFGATYNKVKRVWYFPAHLPFAELVVEDIRKIDPTLLQSPTINNHLTVIQQEKRKLENNELTKSFKFKTTPYDHQVEGLCWLYYNWRAALFWEAGTGKTKVVVDLIRLLKHHSLPHRTLILCPLIAVNTWVKEPEKHAPGEFVITPILGEQKKKISLLATAADSDISVATYGTARTLGVPRIQSGAAPLLKKYGITLTRPVKQLLTTTSSSALQRKTVEKLSRGLPLSDVEIEVSGPQWMYQIGYDLLICDESHRIKDIGSQQTKAVLEMSKHAKRRYLLSGTPTTGDPRHLYPQFKFLAHYLMPENYWSFSQKYVQFSKYHKHIVTGFKNLHIINSRVDRVAIRKTKEECLDLPERVIVDLDFDLSKEQKTAYNDFVKASFTRIGGEDGTIVSAAIPATRLNKLLQITSGFLYGNTDKDSDTERETFFFSKNPKKELFTELLGDLMNSPENKVIVWAWYKAELDDVEDVLKTNKIGYVRVDGKTTKNIRVYEDKFENDDNCRVYLGQMATGISVTLNSANFVVFYGLHWSLEHYLQAIDRNYRAGQTKKITVYRLVTTLAADQFVTAGYDSKKSINDMMVERPDCMVCDKNSYCIKKAIMPFEKGCILKRKTGRVVARAKEV